jgi:hypothetical protein
MHTRRNPRATGRKGRALLLLLILALGALVITGLGACGGESSDDGGAAPSDEGTGVAGVYAYESGTEEGMDAFTLTLKDDGTFSLTQTDPETGEEVGINGTYTVDGDAISLTNDEGSESDAGTVEGDKLVFETITWVKQ